MTKFQFAMAMLFGVVVACLVGGGVAYETCKEQSDGGDKVDGNYTLTLKVDSFKKIESDNDYCAVLVNGSATFVECIAIKQDNFKVAQSTQTKDFEVYCFGMKTATPMAYINVNNERNFAAWVVGKYEFKTSFSKLRFNEETQLIYTADFTFATSAVKNVLNNDTAVSDDYNPCKDASLTTQDWDASDALGLALPLRSSVKCFGQALPYLPYGTMTKSDANGAAGVYKATLSVDFGTGVTYAKLGMNFLFTPLPSLVAYYDDVYDDVGVLEVQVGTSSTRNLADTAAGFAAGFVGVEVSNFQEYVNVKDAVYDAGDPNVYTTDALVRYNEVLSLGGWGLPLCMFDVESSCTPQGTCDIPLNCLYRDLFYKSTPSAPLDAHLVIRLNDGRVARLRPTQTGGVHHILAVPETEEKKGAVAAKKDEDKSSGDGVAIGLGVSGGVVALIVAACCVMQRKKGGDVVPVSGGKSRYEPLVAM